jgi:hypothetical protein
MLVALLNLTSMERLAVLELELWSPSQALAHLPEALAAVVVVAQALRMPFSMEALAVLALDSLATAARQGWEV